MIKCYNRRVNNKEVHTMLYFTQIGMGQPYMDYLQISEIQFSTVIARLQKLEALSKTKLFEVKEVKIPSIGNKEKEDYKGMFINYL
jgi:hypothetical protein